MPKIFGFADEKTALRLRELASEPQLAPEEVVADDIVGWVLLTPPEGIAGMANAQSQSDDLEIPSSMCKTWALVEFEGKIYRRKALDKNGDHYEVRVGNMDSEPVEGSQFIRASRVVGGAMLCDYEICG